MPRDLKLVSFALCACIAGSWVLACGDDGKRTSCEDMPLADDDAEVPSQDPDVQAWWRRAAEKRCATPPIGGFSGAAGAAN